MLHTSKWTCIMRSRIQTWSVIFVMRLQESFFIYTVYSCTSDLWHQLSDVHRKMLTLSRSWYFETFCCVYQLHCQVFIYWCSAESIALLLQHILSPFDTFRQDVMTHYHITYLCTYVVVTFVLLIRSLLGNFWDFLLPHAVLKTSKHEDFQWRGHVLLTHQYDSPV